MMNHSLNASSGSLSSVSSDRSASTDCVEYVTDVPFAGKFFIRHNSPLPLKFEFFFCFCALVSFHVIIECEISLFTLNVLKKSAIIWFPSIL